MKRSGRDAVLTAPLIDDGLLADEIDLETRAIEDGVARYRQLATEAIERSEGAQLKPVERLLGHWFDMTSILIADEIKECKSAVPGIGRVIYGPIIRLLSPDDLALIVLQETANSCLAQPDGIGMTNLAYRIGRGVLAEIEVRMLKKEHPDAFNELQRKYKKHTDMRVRRWWAGASHKPMGKTRACVQTGVALLDCLIRAAACGDYDGDVFEPAFEEYVVSSNVRGRPHKTSMVRMTDVAMRLIDDGHAARQLLRPRYLPMVVRPYRWMEDAQGGYVKIRTPLISKPSPEQKEAMATADLSVPYAAIDALSGTPVRLCTAVYELQERVWNAGGGDLGIPDRRDAVVSTPYPEGGTAEQIKEWNIEAIKVHRENHSLLGQRADHIRLDWIASEFQWRERFYLPHMLEFRGRFFPIPTHLNHHGDDVARSILEFSEPKDAGGPDAQHWLRVHAAGCFGFDKVSFAEQALWVSAHTEEIARSVADPLGFEWWQQADKPWEFLHACMALLDPEIAARIPVQRDGTCNGFQHYSAIGRDPDGARHVNLEPADRPGDLYSAVLAIVEKTVQRDADAGNELAEAVLPLLGRKVVKQNVMTIVYGVTRSGASDQIRERLKEGGMEGSPLYKASYYLSGVVLDSVGELCASASLAMAWLVECARLIVAENRLVSWTTPAGFPVVQPYRRESDSEVRTRLRRLTIRHLKPGAKVWAKKHIDGIAPNFIHSIDATHLMMTAIECERQGVALMTIHDAFRTHAATVGDMDVILREQFVDLHRRPLLDELLGQWRSQHPDIEFPEPPARGSFDIERVLESEYVFS